MAECIKREDAESMEVKKLIDEEMTIGEMVQYAALRKKDIQMWFCADGDLRVFMFDAKEEICMGCVNDEGEDE